jgi:hypothetical protein
MANDVDQPARSKPFWESKTLAEMTREEWESLCDGCGRCCLTKLEDEETGAVVYTDVACRLLDLHHCRCTDYTGRLAKVRDCVELTPGTLGALEWLPDTCAYRRLAAGKNLAPWHPLVSGDPKSVHRAGISIRGRAVSERDVHPSEIEEHVIHWAGGARRVPE